VLEAIEADKKHGAAGLRWVLPKAAGVEVRADVPEALVREVVEGVLAGTAAEATVG
jgi:3-dehydroquinate synthetase